MPLSLSGDTGHRPAWQGELWWKTACVFGSSGRASRVLTQVARAQYVVASDSGCLCVAERERVQQTHAGEEPVCPAVQAGALKPPSCERGGGDAKTPAEDGSRRISVVRRRRAESERCLQPPPQG